MIDNVTLTTKGIKRKKASYGQERMWVLAQLHPESAAYNVRGAVRLVGTLNKVAVEESFSTIIARHEVLRTNFEFIDGLVMQIIHPAQRLKLEIVDFQDAIDTQQAAQAFLKHDAQRPFNLTTDPLSRVLLLCLSEQEYILCMTMHHSICDRWSLGIIMQEFGNLYAANVSHREAKLPALAGQYADYALWQRDWLQLKGAQAQQSFWTEQLKDLPVLELPTDFPRPAVQNTNGARVGLAVGTNLTQRLKALSEVQGVTLFMTLLAAFQVLLSRYSGQSDIPVGTPIANRTHSEVETLIGFFVNTLVLRSRCEGDARFVDLLSQVREMCLAAYAHQDLPFEKLVAELQPVRDMSRAPLFQVMFILQNTPQSTLHLPELLVEEFQVESATAKFDLTLSITETPQGLSAQFEYNTDLFDAATITRMTEHFKTLLEGIVADPQQRLSELPMLSAAERQQLLVEWNATQVEYPQQWCIHQLFEQQVARTPNAIAVVFEKESLTYLELNQRANQLANHICSLGIVPGHYVAICLNRSIDMLVSVLGVLKSGA